MKGHPNVQYKCLSHFHHKNLYIIWTPRSCPLIDAVIVGAGTIIVDVVVSIVGIGAIMVGAVGSIVGAEIVISASIVVVPSLLVVVPLLVGCCAN